MNKRMKRLKFNIDFDRLLYLRNTNPRGYFNGDKGKYSLTKPLIIFPKDLNSDDVKGIYQNAEDYDRTMEFIGKTNIDPSKVGLISKMKTGGFIEPNFRENDIFGKLLRKISEKQFREIPKTPYDDNFSALVQDALKIQIPRISNRIVQNVPTVIRTATPQQMYPIYPRAIRYEEPSEEMINSHIYYGELQPFLPHSTEGFSYNGRLYKRPNYSLFLHYKDNPQMNYLDLNSSNYRSTEDKSKLLSFDPLLFNQYYLENLYR